MRTFHVVIFKNTGWYLYKDSFTNHWGKTSNLDDAFLFSNRGSAKAMVEDFQGERKIRNYKIRKVNVKRWLMDL